MHCRQGLDATESNKSLTAEEVIKEMRQQREQMSAQLFGLKQTNTALQETVTTLQEDKRVLQEQLEQQAAEKEIEVGTVLQQILLLYAMCFESCVCFNHWL